MVGLTPFETDEYEIIELDIKFKNFIFDPTIIKYKTFNI